jgi:NitT/TauT family transport system ATP-binding protein
MLRLEGLTIRAGRRLLVERLSLELTEGGVTCLIGPSGCGKTSALKWLAGIPAPGTVAEGRLTLDGVEAPRPHPAIAYQPQSDALFPWLTVARNAALGLETRGTGRRAARARVLPLFEQFGLAGCADLYPDQLSGGMRQRAAFLRTVVQDSRFVLLDEPFSALDAVTRLRMQDWLSARLAETRRGVLLVTHDLHEAAQLADRILVMPARPGPPLTEIVVPAPRGARDEALLAPIRAELKTLLTKEDP